MKLKTILIYTLFLTFNNLIAKPAGRITISGLDKFQGQYLSLYYVSGKKASFGTQGQELETVKILKGPFIQFIDKDHFIFPPLEVPSNGFSNFNYILTVIHEQKYHFLTNIVLSNNGVVERLPVATVSDLVVEDNEENRLFTTKKFKSYFRPQNELTIDYSL